MLAMMSKKRHSCYAYNYSKTVRGLKSLISPAKRTCTILVSFFKYEHGKQKRRSLVTDNVQNVTNPNTCVYVAQIMKSIMLIHINRIQFNQNTQAL